MIITKANKEKWTKPQKKEIGGPALFVSFKWLAEIGSNHMDKANEAARGQLKEIFDKAKEHHFMDKIFSHSQAWVTHDKKKAYIRFKLQPWYRDVELLFAFILTNPGTAGNAVGKIEGQPAPRGPRLMELENTMEPIKGKGKGGAKNEGKGPQEI